MSDRQDECVFESSDLAEKINGGSEAYKNLLKVGMIVDIYSRPFGPRDSNF